MSTPRLVELAKEGNPQAIAILINQQLKTRGVTAVASRQGHCLRLLLEAPKQPNESILVPYLCKALTKLDSPAIQQVELYGRKQGELQGWQTLLTLMNHEFVAASNPVGAPSHPPTPSLATAQRNAVRREALHQGNSHILAQASEARRRRSKWATPEPEEQMDSLEAALIGPRVTPGKPKVNPVKKQPISQRSTLQSSQPETPLSESPILKTPETNLPNPGIPQGVPPQVDAANSDLPETPAQATHPPHRVQSPSSTQHSSASSPHPSLSSSQPAITLKSLGLWLRWQWAAWSTTLLLMLIVVPVLTLIFFGIFSLLNRFDESEMLKILGISLLVILPLLGLLLGDAQTRLLRQRLYGIGGWRWVTMLGVVLGFGIAIGSHVAIKTVFSPVVAEPDPEFVIGRGLPFVASTLGVGMGCLFLGFLQWLMISTSIARSYLWPLATGLGSILSWIAGMLISAAWFGPRFLSSPAEPSSFWSTLFLWLVGGLLSWLLFHALSGVVMAGLLQGLPRVDQEDV